MAPAGNCLAKSLSSSLTRTTKGAAEIAFGATAEPATCTCPLSIACRTLSILPL
jgi:hypothetical protein